MTGSLPHTLGYLAHLLAVAAGLLAIGPLTRRAEGRWTGWLLGLGCAAIAAASFAASDPPKLFHDFRIAYYPAGRAVLHDPAALHDLIAQGVSGFVNLPAVAYLFAPFAAAPEPLAIAAFTALGLACVAGAWLLIARLGGLDRTARWRLALLVCASGPLHYSLREGNLSHMVLLALAGALALLLAGRSAAAGVVLGVAALLKPPLAVMGLVLLLRRDARGLAGFAATGMAAGLLSLLLFGWAENLHWFRACILAFGREWLAAFNVQSIAAFLLRLQAPPSRLMDWTPFPPPEAVRIAAQLAVAGLLAATAAACLRPPPPGADARSRLVVQYGLVLCLALLASPLAWSHYYVWLLLPAGLLLGAGPGPLGWTAILLLTPLVWPLNPADALAATLYRTLWSSHLLFAGLLLFALTAARLLRPAARAGAPAWSPGQLAPDSAK